MDSWAVVLADTVLILVTLTGAAITVVRMRRVGGSAAVLAGAACAALVLAAILDLIWWTRLVPDAVDAGDADRAASLTDTGVLVTFLLITVGVGLLIAATNVGRPAVAVGEPVAASRPAAPAYQPVNGIPSRYTPQNQQAPQQPAQGWTPPQQQGQQPQGQPDWNIHSGVWSIPRGTFDGPPPDQRRR